jgi:hypothetical protein
MVTACGECPRRRSGRGGGGGGGWGVEGRSQHTLCALTTTTGATACACTPIAREHSYTQRVEMLRTSAQKQLILRTSAQTTDIADVSTKQLILTTPLRSTIVPSGSLAPALPSSAPLPPPHARSLAASADSFDPHRATTPFTLCCVGIESKVSGNVWTLCYIGIESMVRGNVWTLCYVGIESMVSGNAWTLPDAERSRA